MPQAGHKVLSGCHPSSPLHHPCCQWYNKDLNLDSTVSASTLSSFPQNLRAGRTSCAQLYWVLNGKFQTEQIWETGEIWLQWELAEWWYSKWKWNLERIITCSIFTSSIIPCRLITIGYNYGNESLHEEFGVQRLLGGFSVNRVVFSTCEPKQWNSPSHLHSFLHPALSLGCSWYSWFISCILEPPHCFY